jgi:hypothetical protein
VRIALTPALLHQDQVRSGVRLIEHPTLDRIRLMTVHPAKDQLRPVDAEDVTVNLDPPKAQP